MVKQAPTLGKVLVMVVFSLSCFGILTYLWQTFGGSVPIKAEGYRIEADFDEATTLADNADVRISGVKVGKVIGSELALDTNRSRVTMEIDAKYAPIPRNTRAILRQKTLLGETYIEISPGSRDGPSVPDGGRLAQTQIKPTVELDEILSSFEPETQAALLRFLDGTAGALDERGEDLSDSVGNLAPFSTDANDFVQLLDRQRGAVRSFVRDTGVVLGALGGRQGQLTGLVEAADTVLTTTARRNAELTETVRILPTTLRELRPTLSAIETVSGEAAPLVRDLRPAGRALAPTLRDALLLAPDLRELFGDLDRVTTSAKTALPATTKTVDSAHKLFKRLPPTLQEAAPVVDYLGRYKREVVATFGGVAGATQATAPGNGGKPIHYLRSTLPLSSEALIAASTRAGSNRHNPYFAPGAMDKLAGGLESIDCRNAGPAIEPAPPCKTQAPFDLAGERSQFPQLKRAR